VGSRVKVDGRMLAPRGPYYLEVRKRWHSPSVVKITLPVKPRLVASHPYVRDNFSKAAIHRGPLIYCLESIDNPVDPREIVLARRAVMVERWKRDLLGRGRRAENRGPRAGYWGTWPTALHRS
jgi:DUF1680 family protein